MVENQIVNANYTYVSETKKKGVTVYGDIAGALEAAEPKIDEFSEMLSAYFGSKKLITNFKTFEEKSSNWEKYICNNTISIKQLQLKNSKDIDFISAVTQSTIKLMTRGLKKIFQHKDEMAAKDYIWTFLRFFANNITEGRYTNYKVLEAFMVNLGKQIYGGKFVSIYANDDDYKKITKTCVLFDPVQEMQIAIILHSILSVKHYKLFLTQEEYENDKRKLFDMWAMLGIIMDEAEELFENCENVRINKKITYGIINELVYSFTNNFSLELPKINREISRKVNRELLQYTPNASKQLGVRKVVKFGANAIMGIATAHGKLSMDNQLLITAATTALSMFKETDNKDNIANILKKSGIAENDVRKCIEDSEKIKKNEEPVI